MIIRMCIILHIDVDNEFDILAVIIMSMTISTSTYISVNLSIEIQNFFT